MTIIQHRRLAVYLAAALGLTVVEGCTESAPGALGEAAAECGGDPCEAFDAEHHAWQLDRLRRLFGGLYNTSYRTEMFALLSELKKLSAAEMVERLDIAAEVAAQGGADGLEPILLALADGIHHHGDAAAAAQAREILAGLERWYIHEVPFDDMLEPIGRSSTRVVISVRPAAARALLGSLVANPTAMRMEDLLNLAGTQEGVCAMPKVRSDAQMLEQLAELDHYRQVDCETGVIGKGGKNGPSVARRISVDACLDVPLDSMRDSNDEYSMADRMADLDQCMNDLQAHFRPNDPGTFTEGEGTAAKAIGGLLPEIKLDLGQVATEQIKQVYETARAVGAAANGYGKAWWDLKLQQWRDEQKKQSELDDKVIDAYADLAGAAVELAAAETLLGQAQRDLAAAREAYDQAQRAVDDAVRDQTCFECSQEEKDALQRAVDEAKAKLDKAKEDLEKAEKAKKDAEAAYIAARKAAAEAAARLAEIQKQRNKGDDEDDDFHSAACNRLIGNGRDFTDPGDIGRLPEDWTEMETWLDLVSYPDPNDPGEVGAGATFGLPSCGADLPTTRGASNCESLTQCGDPSVQCSCNLDAEKKEKQAMDFAESRAGLVCHTTTCPEGTTPRPVGQVCTCDDGEQQEPKPRPLPVEDVFVTSGEVELAAPGGAAERTGLANLARDAFLAP